MHALVFAFPVIANALKPTAREVAGIIVEVRRAEMLHLDAHAQGSAVMHAVAGHAIAMGMGMIPRCLGRQAVFRDRVQPQAARQFARVLDERQRASR